MKSELRIFKDVDTLSREAAEIFVQQAAQAIAERGRFLVALNGGSTPLKFFQALATEYRHRINWSKTHVFWGDERCVPPNDPASNYAQAHEVMLSRVSIPEANIHRIKGELEPAEASRDYALTLKGFSSPPLDVPRFDLVYLGMGEDGHTASLFPGSPVNAAGPTLPVIAHYENRPAHRVTLTPLVFNQARMVVFMVTGEKKSVVLAEVLRGRYNPERYPAQRINPHDGKLIWLVDADAARHLS
ncbi:MAG TPA: 6-phosphogluconolactonase [Anaerolineales bacterium]|nr:6-phosphogluconolactonase [Anaerolineales bacterium]